MTCLSLVEYKCREAVAVLKMLLSMALQGKIRGLVICYRDGEGEEHTVYTGAYKASPGKAAGATLRASLALMQANGELQ